MHDNNDAHKLVVGCVRHAAPRVAEAVGESISITEELLNGRQEGTETDVCPRHPLSLCQTPQIQMYIETHIQSYMGAPVKLHWRRGLCHIESFDRFLNCDTFY